MSRLEQRWRTPQNAISVVNGRIPRIKRKLNAYCTFRISLKVCLVQGVYIFMPRNMSDWCLTSFGVCAGVVVRQWWASAIHWRIRLNSKCAVSLLSGDIIASATILTAVWSVCISIAVSKLFSSCAWTQARLPAEFKHISKRRTRKWTWFR